MRNDNIMSLLLSMSVSSLVINVKKMLEVLFMYSCIVIVEKKHVFFFLTLSQTSPGFYMSAVRVY